MITWDEYMVIALNDNLGWYKKGLIHKMITGLFLSQMEITLSSQVTIPYYNPKLSSHVISSLARMSK
jgi:hypothetical protein